MSTSPIGPRTFAVVPARLHAARSSQEVGAQVLAEVARAVGGLDVPTGRSDTADGCADLLHELSVSLRAAVVDLRRAGAAVSAAGTRYTVVDGACLGGRACD